MNHQENLTTGSVPRQLIGLALPLLGANLLQSGYSLADMLLVGQLVGQTGLAAISNASMLCFILNALGLGVSMGGTVLAAKAQGAENPSAKQAAVGACLTLSVAAAVLVTIVGLVGYGPLFKLLAVPKAALPEACAYMRVICLGTVFVFGYNAVCSLMKGFGDGKGPLFFVAVAAVLNVLLDLVFIGPLQLGCKGAAYATILAQAAALLLAALGWQRQGFIVPKPSSFIPRIATLAAILRIGIPASLQMVVVNCSYLLITGLLNHFGVAVAAACGIGLKINTLAGMPCWAIGQAVTVMVAQSLGAGDYNRVRAVTRCGLALSLSSTLLSIALVQLLAYDLMTLFEPSQSEVLAEGVRYLRICCSVNSLFYAVMYTLDAFAIGVDAAGVALINALLDALIVRLPVSYLLAFPWHLGPLGIYLGQAISPLLPALLGILYFQSRAWQKRHLHTSA